MKGVLHMCKYSKIMLLCYLCAGCGQDANVCKYDSTVNSLEQALKMHPPLEKLMSFRDAWGRKLLPSAPKDGWMVLISQGADPQNDKDDIRISYNVQTGAYDIFSNYQGMFYARGFFPE